MGETHTVHAIRLWHIRANVSEAAWLSWTQAVALKNYPSWARLSDIEYVAGKLRALDLDTSDIDGSVDNLSSIFQVLDEEMSDEAAIYSCMIGAPVGISVSRSGTVFLVGPSEAKPVLQKFFDGLKLDKLHALIPGNSMNALGVLRDRPTAARILSEGLAAGNSSGALTQFVRLFEAAFAMKHNALKNRLHRFLASGPLGIRKEISDSWIEARHGVSHGKDPAATAFSMDVLNKIKLCRMAAYDVALNKKDWGSETFDRRTDDALSSYVDAAGNASRRMGHFALFGYPIDDPLGRYEPSSLPDRMGFMPSLDFPALALSLYGEEYSPTGTIGGTEHGLNTIEFYRAFDDKKGEGIPCANLPLFKGNPVKWNLTPHQP